MNIEKISPYIRVALDYTVPPEWYLRERIIFDYELLFVREGEVLVTIEDKSFSARPGEFVLIRPGQTHSMRQIGNIPFRHPHIHFDFYQDVKSEDIKVNFRPLSELNHNERHLVRKDCLSSYAIPIPNLIRVNNPSVVLESMDEIIRLQTDRPYLYELASKGLFIILWGELIKAFMSSNAKNADINESMNYIYDYIDKHWRERLTNKELADLVNYSESYFTAIFKQMFGTTPHRHRTERCIAYACDLLEYTADSISDIADKCAYHSIQAFSNAFKQNMGITPSEYRKQARRNERKAN